MDKEEQFYNKATTDYLKRRLNIANPTKEQIEEMKSTLFHVWLRKRIIFDKSLTNREKDYLFWASCGKNYLEIAEILGISPETVRNYEKDILEKLKCKNMKQAIAQGIRYGEIAVAQSY